MYLEYSDKNKHHKLEIRETTKKDLQRWQSEVMPHEKSQAAQWNWEKFMTREYRLAKYAGQNPKFISLTINNKPVGMMLIANDFKAQTRFDQKKEKTTYVWYLQSAPNDYLKKQNIDKTTFDLSIGKILLDAAVVNSFKSGNDGKTLLHADPEAKGNILLEYYSKQGFTRIEDERIKHVSPFRENDGRYFHLNKASAKLFILENRQAIGQKLIIEKPTNNIKNKSLSR
jgi:ribosomal protein S18 acetylase RimI-like enzyme